MSLPSRLLKKRPPRGFVEVCNRVYVFGSCFSTEVLPEGIYQRYLHETITELHKQFPDFSCLALNFREGEKRSQFAEILCEYDITVIDYPRQYQGCPLLPLSLIHHFVRTSEIWLSLGDCNNVVLLHCERGGWPLLAFVLASFMVLRKFHHGERITLEMILRKFHHVGSIISGFGEAPRGFLQLLSPLNPFPSQLRYLEYVSRRNTSPEWPPPERALFLDCLILRAIPEFDNQKGCRPIIRIYGRNPHSKDGLWTSMIKMSRHVRHYRQKDSDVIKIDIQCLVQGDVVLECVHVDLAPEREVIMFRVMFNTAFIHSNILMLNCENLDICWGLEARFPKAFRAEVLFGDDENQFPSRSHTVMLNGEERGSHYSSSVSSQRPLIDHGEENADLQLAAPSPYFSSKISPPSPPPPPPLPTSSRKGPPSPRPPPPTGSTKGMQISHSPPPPPTYPLLSLSKESPPTMTHANANEATPPNSRNYSSKDFPSTLSVPLPSKGTLPLPPPPPPPPPSRSVPPPPIVHRTAPPPPPPPPPRSRSAPPPPIFHRTAPPPSPLPPRRGLVSPPPPSPPRRASAPPPPPPPPPLPPPQSRGRGRGSISSIIPRMRTSLKPLHWLRATCEMQGSFWADSQKQQESQSRAPEIDISELESPFSVASASDAPKASACRSKINEPGKLQLIDLLRAYNCEIMLTKLKIPPVDMLNTILAFNSSVLDIDQVENLIKFCPTKEEMEILKNYNGNKEALGKCEQFFMQLMRIPRVESKLRVYAFTITFNSQVNDLKLKLNTINDAAREVMESSKFRQIVPAVVNLGNASKHGTARGYFVGFELDCFQEFSDFPNKMTLMHYLCEGLAKKRPEVLDFSKDLEHLEPASKIQLKSLAEEIQFVREGLEKVKQEFAASANDGALSLGFRKVLKMFLDTAEAEVRSLINLFTVVRRNADSLSQYFGEDPARCPFEQVTQILAVFTKLFNKAHDENEQAADAAKKNWKTKLLRNKQQ